MANGSPGSQSDLGALRKKSDVKVGSSVPNPNGRTGGKAHQLMTKIVKDTAETAVSSSSLSITTEAQMVSTSSQSFKPWRFADVAISESGCDVLTHAYQIGRTTQGGMPVAREMKAIHDFLINGVSVTFFSYTQPGFCITFLP